MRKVIKINLKDNYGDDLNRKELKESKSGESKKGTGTKYYYSNR